jgi:Flp pilus assembly protein TadG
VLVLLMLGAVDFGRVMYAGMTVTNAARAGGGMARKQVAPQWIMTA